MTTKNNPPLKRSIEGIILCVSLIALILTTEITLQSQIHQQLSQRSYELSENAFASTTESIPANNFDGIITNVIDGDTLDISTNDGNSITVRLVLVDAPEINELGYNEAKDFVTQNCLDKHATVDPDNNQDLSYGRLVALVYCNGLNINEVLIAAGFADIYGSFCEESEFGVSEWAQNYGCAADTDLPNSEDASEGININDDDEQEEVSNDCDSAYSDICVPSPPPDLDCGDVPEKNFKVGPPDPHSFDGDSDGIGCET